MARRKGPPPEDLRPDSIINVNASLRGSQYMIIERHRIRLGGADFSTALRAIIVDWAESQQREPEQDRELQY